MTSHQRKKSCLPRDSKPVSPPCRSSTWFTSLGVAESQSQHIISLSYARSRSAESITSESELEVVSTFASRRSIVVTTAGTYARGTGCSRSCGGLARTLRPASPRSVSRPRRRQQRRRRPKWSRRLLLARTARRRRCAAWDSQCRRRPPLLRRIRPCAVKGPRRPRAVRARDSRSDPSTGVRPTPSARGETCRWIGSMDGMTGCSRSNRRELWVGTLLLLLLLPTKTAELPRPGRRCSPARTPTRRKIETRRRSMASLFARQMEDGHVS